MIARIQKSMKEDEGFTLIELLVVIIIIGILAAIAIPIFLNQRKKAVDASMKSDAKSIANSEETYAVDSTGNAYVAATQATAGGVMTLSTGLTVQLSNGNTAIVSTAVGTPVRPGVFCVTVSNPNSGNLTWAYISDLGGLQAAGTTACK
jgi:type IV pilus assembly protein PilA